MIQARMVAGATEWTMGPSPCSSPLEKRAISNERSKSPGRAHHVHEVPVLPPEAVEWAKVVLLVLLEVEDDGGVRTAFMDDMGPLYVQFGANHRHI